MLDMESPEYHSLLTSHGHESKAESRRFSEVDSSRRLSVVSNRRESYDQTLIEYAHLYQYKPLHHAAPIEVEIIDLEDGTTDVTMSYIRPQQAPRLEKAYNCFFPSHLKSVLGLFKLRVGLILLSIFQLVTTYFSLEFVWIAFGGTNLNASEVLKPTFLQKMTMWYETIQNHVVIFDPYDLISTLRSNLGLIIFRNCFSLACTTSCLMLLRRYSDELGFVTAFFLGVEFFVSIGVFIARIPNGVSGNDWDGWTIAAFFTSSIICVIYSWCYLVIELCYWTQQQKVLAWLSRCLPDLYGPAYYHKPSMDNFLTIPTSPEELSGKRPIPASRQQTVLPTVGRGRRASQSTSTEQEPIASANGVPEVTT